MAHSDSKKRLIKAVKADYAKLLGGGDKRLASLLAKIQSGKGTFEDVSAFSSKCGEALSAALTENISPVMMRSPEFTQDIANEILAGMLHQNYELINMAAQAVQENIDSKMNIHISAQKPEFPTERVSSIASSLKDENASDATLSRRIDSPVRNVSDSFYSDYVKENAELRSRAGLKAVVIRQTNGNCCDWCSSLAGRYEYPDVPDGIWGFHDNCTCSVTYSTSKVTSIHNRQNKRGRRLEGKEREEVLARIKKPTVYTKEQAKNLQYSVLNRVAKSGESGIIKSIDVDDYELVTYGKGINPEVSNVIIDTMKKCEKNGGFTISEISTDIKSTSEKGTAVLQIEPMHNGLLRLNVNADFLKGKTLQEIDEIFSKSENTVVNSLNEAVIHESGHAKSIRGKNIEQINELYDKLAMIHFKGVSDIAFNDGAECLAELEVLRSRGVQLTDNLKEFYKEFMGSDY